MELFKKLKEVHNGALAEYLETHVLPQYDARNGHGAEHIAEVLGRAFTLVENLKLGLSLPLVATAVVYHDIGRKINDELHEKISATLFLEDEKMKEFFSDSERQVIAQAIEDHRASLKGMPRSDYGKLVSSADRHTKVECPLKMTYCYRKAKYPHLTDEEITQESFEHLSKKFGEGGYADKAWYDDGQYQKYLEDLRHLLRDYDGFRTEYRKINDLK